MNLEVTCMYYGYKIVDADGAKYTGAVYAEDFVDAMDRIDDFYDDVSAICVGLVCLTEGECLDIGEFDDEDNDDEEYVDTCDGNFTITAHTTVTPHLDVKESVNKSDIDKLKEIVQILDKLEAEEK